MLSFGIQFGEGFDEVTVLRMSQTIPKQYDYDLLVIGSNPGGVACAREARSAGLKTAIITWKNYSPAEADGYDEDVGDMAAALELTEESYIDNNRKRTSAAYDSGRQSTISGQYKIGSTIVITSSRKNSTVGRRNSKKVRESRLDLRNELFKRGKQCRKLMHNAVRLGDLVEDAYNSGWRLSTTRPPLTMNWKKMSEEVMDYVMEENWKLAKELGEESVEIIEGLANFEDSHTVKVMMPDLAEITYTAEIICIALSTDCILPTDIPGARKYGITCDDFIRLNEPPGKTLIVGSLPESMECAGIVAGGRFPVTVVSRSKILKGYDSEISQMIIKELRKMGVVFKEEIKLKSIEATVDKKLLATFVSQGEAEDSVTETKEAFDTVVFAIGRKINPKNLDFDTVGIDFDPANEKIRVDKEKTTVENIFAVGDVLSDCPEDFEVSQLAGKLLGKRLFHEGTDFMNYAMIPTVMYTPTEYACVGLSEDAALDRLGIECVDVYKGYFKPLDFVVPSKNGECFAKVIVLKTKGEIIGLHLYGPEAGEIIQGFAATIRNGLTLTNFRTIVGITASKAQEILKLKETRTNIKLENEEPPLE